mgnify:CR=1 FL=1
MQKLRSIPLIDAQSINSTEEARVRLTSAYDDLCAAMHEAASEAVSVTSRPPRQPHQKQWWTPDCTAARNRCRLFFHIWKESGRPSQGIAYETYRDARKNYRRVCRTSTNAKIRKSHQLLNDLYSARNPRKFWSMVRRMKSRKQSSDDAMDVTRLSNHFTQKFAAAPLQTDFLKQTDDEVRRKYDSLQDVRMNTTISEAHMKRLMSKLRLGCASGVDGITAENLHYAKETSLPLHLCRLMSACLHFGCIPDVFSLGLLVPILKKPHLDPGLPSNYRPITISSITSKLIELYICEKADQNFDSAQFGFVPHRGTTTAIRLAHDVSQYCVARGSAVYLCSLDDEGAVGAIPFCVLFMKAAESLPDCCWRVMFT